MGSSAFEHEEARAPQAIGDIINVKVDGFDLIVLSSSYNLNRTHHGLAPSNA